jgi:hypothetical protein
MNQTKQLTPAEFLILSHLSNACDKHPALQKAILDAFGHSSNPEHDRLKESTPLDSTDTNSPFTELLCKRCSKRVTSLKKPIRSSRATQLRFAGICSDCITPKERGELKSATLADFIAKNGGGQ